MNNELERIWKDVALASFKALPRYLPRGTEENWKTSVRISSLQAEIRNQDLLNKKQEC
jgi:hypothetical protein